MRRVVDRINERHRAGGVGHADDFGDRIDGAESVRSIADCDEARARSDLAAKIVEIERAIGFADVDLPNHDVFFLERAPGSDVCIVIECGDDDFIARLSSRPWSARARR